VSFLNLTKLGFVLIVAGIVLAVIAVVVPPLLVALQQPEQVATGVSGAGCIVVLFIPICFGFGPQQLVLPLIVLAIAVTIIFAVIALLMYRWSIKAVESLGKRQA
jgi:uncharacterized membrane protein